MIRHCENIADIKSALEIQNMLLVCKAVLMAALHRQESRNAHYREDFPVLDEKQWGKPVYISLKETNRIELF